MSANELVTDEDQNQINLFANQAGKYKSLQFEHHVISEQLNKNRDAKSNLEDIIGEDKVKIFLGEVFVQEDIETAMEMLEKKVNDNEKHLNDKSDEIMKLKQQMDIIKAQLTAKFGKAINLEED